MVNCEVSKCDNVQSAICLHCYQHLCTPHIVEHGKALLRDVDDLYQEVNELSEQLAKSSKSVLEACANAEAECNAWRSEALKTVEQTYNKMMQPILYQQECFNKLERDITVRLSIDAKQPLEKMQTQQIGNAQALDTVRLALNHVKCVIPLFQWPQNPLLPLPNPAVELKNSHKTKINGVPLPLPLFNKAEDKIYTPLNERSDPDVPTSWEMLVTNAHLRLDQNTSADQVEQNPILPTIPRSTTSTEQRLANIQFATADLYETQNLQNYKPFKKMVVRFADVSANGERLLNDYLQNCIRPVRKKKMSTLIKIVLAFLHAWYKNKTSSNGDLILQRVSKVKKYITNDNDKFTVILAVQIFMHHIQKDAQIVQTMTTILEFFLEQQLILKDGVLEWYNTNHSYGFVGAHTAKQCAQTFIENLQSTIV